MARARQTESMYLGRAGICFSALPGVSLMGTVRKIMKKRKISGLFVPRNIHSRILSTVNMKIPGVSSGSINFLMFVMIWTGHGLFRPILSYRTRWKGISGLLRRRLRKSKIRALSRRCSVSMLSVYPARRCCWRIIFGSFLIARSLAMPLGWWSIRMP